MSVKTVVALGGEGIGVQVVDATCELLGDQGGTATSKDFCRATLEALG
jgi:hypothetical protein